MLENTKEYFKQGKHSPAALPTLPRRATRVKKDDTAFETNTPETQV